MEANEFVKNFGWDKAKEVASFTSNVCADPTHFDSDLDIYIHFDDFKGVMDESDVCIEDLKRLVESNELVQVGLPELKKAMFSDSKDLEYVKNWLLTVSEKLLTEKGIRLKQAIADVESCQ